jgi:hypothetical protein
MDSIGLGSEIKINLHVEPMGNIHLRDYDFNVRVYTNAKNGVNVEKQDMIEVDEDNYIILVDTAKLSRGKVYLTFNADIPDSDFDDGLRHEVSIVETNIQIVR